MDTQARTIAKTILWRIIATSMTFGVSYWWLQDVTSSLALAIAANLVKTFAYYGHERGWNAWSWGRNDGAEMRVRSVAKSMSWRAVATAVTLGASLFWIDSFKDAASFVGVAMSAKIFIYYLHERSWNAIGWGKLVIPQISQQVPRQSTGPVLSPEASGGD